MRRSNPNSIFAFHKTLVGMLPVWAIGVLLAVVSQPTLSAANVESDAQQEEEDKEPIRQTLDLGRFRIRELHPAQGETTSVMLTLQLALSPKVKESTVEALQHWHHRLRDQTIIAIRVADTADFSEPGLKRLRRLILLRVNRLFKQPLVEEIFFTEFTFAIQ